MKKLAVLFAALTLAGCYNPQYPSETPGDRPRPNETGASGNASADGQQRQSVNTVHNTYRTGTGMVVALTRPSSAAAGATSTQSTEVTIRMDDGTQQTVALPGETELRVGDRVEVTRDPYVLRR